ncbi:hypothetical protein ABZW11_44750, partial [Nonomuraea sp. NPDC004580]|uniref:hypothetical protein n=1 Tax=Nonomuraea sp. NPDC004580 TaxID=3154552 RepID=UPI0033B35A88
MQAVEAGAGLGGAAGLGEGGRAAARHPAYRLGVLEQVQQARGEQVEPRTQVAREKTSSGVGRSATSRSGRLTPS